MFCKKCGTEISRNSKYCFRCGIQNPHYVSEEEDNELKYQLTPHFHFLYQFFHLSWLTFFIIGFLLFKIFVEGSKTYENMETIYRNIFWMTLGLTILYQIVRAFVAKVQCKHKIYRFYRTKAECESGIFNKKYQSFKYSSVREVVVSHNLFERALGLGRITIYTTAYATENRMLIPCLKDAEEKCKIIKKIIDESTHY